MPNMHPIVGVWYATIIGAPFAQHMLTFHADGTMTQANPDAGDAATSDSIGMGLWIADGDIIRAKFIEITASRTTHAFVARGEIILGLYIDGDTMSGTASATFYDENNLVISGPTRDTVRGRRVIIDAPVRRAE